MYSFLIINHYIKGQDRHGLESSQPKRLQLEMVMSFVRLAAEQAHPVQGVVRVPGEGEI